VLGVVVGVLAVPSGLAVARLFVPSDGLPVVEPSGSLGGRRHTRAAAVAGGDDRRR